MEKYVVQKGDTLGKIAMYFFGDPTDWRKIFNANKATIKNPDMIMPGQVLTVPIAVECGQNKQRSMMSHYEQLQCPEEGLSYPIEFEIMELLVGATALLKGLFKAGAKVFTKQAAKKSDDLLKTVVNPKTGKKEWPNSPYRDKTRDPREIRDEINKKIESDMADAARNGNKTIGKQNAEIQKIHDEFIKTGKWPLKRKDLGEYHMSTPDKGLMKARENYLKALKEHQ